MPTFLEAAGGADGADGALSAVRLERLVRLVRLRQLLRLVSRLGVLALLAWFGVLVAATEHEGSPHWDRIDDYGNHGFVVILLVLALDVVLLLGCGVLGPEGRAAARFVPALRRTPDPIAGPVGRPASLVRVEAPKASKQRADKAGPPPSLLDLGTRRRRTLAPERSRGAGFVLVLMLLGFLALAAYTAAKVGPTYRASHGRGGPVVTIGKDSHISRRVANDDPVVGRGRQPGYTYYITSPRGEVQAEGSGKPQDGTRFAVVTLNGQLRAVHLGGHSWVTDLVLAIVGSVLAVALIAVLVHRFATRVVDDRIIPLGVTLAGLAGGALTSVRPGADGGAVELRAEPLPAAGAGAVVAAQRRATLVLNLAVVLVLAAVGLLVAYA